MSSRFFIPLLSPTTVKDSSKIYEDIECITNNEALFCITALNGLNDHIAPMVDTLVSIEALTNNWVRSDLTVPEMRKKIRDQLKAHNLPKPPKTEQELNDEVIQAAIIYDTVPTAKSVTALSEATKAWLDFKNNKQ